MKLLACLAAAALFPAPARAQGPPRTQTQPSLSRVSDAWSDPIEWRTADGWHAAAIHLTLLPDGRVHAIGIERPVKDPQAPVSARRSSFLMRPTPLGQPLPDEVVVQSLVQPIEYDSELRPPFLIEDELYCAGHSLMRDSRIFTAGGSRNATNLRSGEDHLHGLAYATIFDRQGWKRVPNEMTATSARGLRTRWYPSVTRLTDGRMLVTAGYDRVNPRSSWALSTEIYDPRTGSWTIHAPYGGPASEIFNGDYTHIAILPEALNGYDLLMFGQFGVPVLCDVEDGTRWKTSDQERPGKLPNQLTNVGTSSLLLPLRVNDGEWGYRNGCFFMTGGKHGSTHMDAVDVYDPAGDFWLPRRFTGVMRHHPSTVLLPTGEILITGGHAKQFSPALHHATYLDPARGFSMAAGTDSQGRVRGYHNVAVLLPDGRVLTGGGRDLDTLSTGEKSDFQYLYPAYMFRPRPVIEEAPKTIEIGQTFTLEASGNPREVVLLALGSMTHSFDFNQRYVQLQVTGQQGTNTAIVRGPVSARHAPPGGYLLFVLDDDRTPSEGRFVEVLEATSPPPLGETGAPAAVSVPQTAETVQR